MDESADIDSYIDRQFARQDESQQYVNLVSVTDKHTGEQRLEDINTAVLEDVIMDAKLRTELKPEFTHVKNYYENQLMHEYT